MIVSILLSIKADKLIAGVSKQDEIVTGATSPKDLSVSRAEAQPALAPQPSPSVAV